MHELIVHDWLDHDYLQRHTQDWERMRERALQWPPQRVAQVCGIDPDQVRRLARDLPCYVAIDHWTQGITPGIVEHEEQSGMP